QKLPGDPDLADLRHLYLRDPRAAINVASQRHGYRPREVMAPEPLVTPDAPAPHQLGEGGILTTGTETAQAIGGGAIAIANDSFVASTHSLAELRAGWKSKHGHEPSAIHYDAESNRLWFEAAIEIEGKL